MAFNWRYTQGNVMDFEDSDVETTCKVCFFEKSNFSFLRLSLSTLKKWDDDIHLTVL